jgi:hypothetical protein
VNYKRNFQEQFEDSELYNSQEMGAAGPINMNEDGYPIQLLKINGNGRVEVDDKAL